MRAVWLLVLTAGLVGCLNLEQARVTPEHRQLKNRAAVVVLLDAAPRAHHLQLSALESTTATLAMPGFDVRTTVGAFLAQRMRAMGLEVRSVPYDDTTFPNPYDSSMAYADTGRLRPALGTWAAQQGLDMVVVVYRLSEQDFIGDSVENLVGYGLVRHGDSRTDAYAALTLEALDTAGRVIGNAEALKHAPLDNAVWQPEFSRDRQAVTASGEVAATVQDAVTRILQDAVMLAAQEAGLSH